MSAYGKWHDAVTQMLAPVAKPPPQMERKFTIKTTDADGYYVFDETNELVFIRATAWLAATEAFRAGATQVLHDYDLRDAEFNEPTRRTR
jgi:hypothetical protein